MTVMSHAPGRGKESSKNNAGKLGTDYHAPATVEDLTKRNIETVAALEHATREQRSRADCIADAIAAFCGSMAFIYVHLVWFGAWIVLNSPLVPKHMPLAHFDPFPYQFLTLTVSLEAIFLSAFILISQNRQGRIDERRNHLDLQINLLSEQENSKMLAMLESIQKHLGIEDSDPEVSVLEAATQPEQLAQQIEQILEKEAHPKGKA